MNDEIIQQEDEAIVAYYEQGGNEEMEYLAYLDYLEVRLG